MEELNTDVTNNKNMIQEEKEIIDYKQKYEELENSFLEQKNKYLYLAAEYDNYKKRVFKEKQEIVNYTKENFYNELLPLIDDIERTLKNTVDSNDIDIIKDGNNVIHNKFKSFLSKNNIQEIDDIGFEFNSNYHEAISAIESTEDNKNKVIDVVQKGYKINDKVIRYSKVIVGK